MGRYTKAIVAVVTAIATAIGVELDESTVVQVIAFVGAVLVYLLPNRA